MNDRLHTIGRISEMLYKIENVKLLNRIYRFVTYIYIYKTEVQA